MANNKFFDYFNLNRYHAHISSMIKSLSDSIDERVNAKFEHFIGDNVSDGEILDARKGEKTLRKKIDNIDKEIDTLKSRNNEIDDETKNKIKNEIKNEISLEGIQGVPGEKGEKGDKGDKGEQGLRGEKGDKGTFDTTTTFATLNTNNKTVIGAINELLSLLNSGGGTPDGVISNASETAIMQQYSSSHEVTPNNP